MPVNAYRSILQALGLSVGGDADFNLPPGTTTTGPLRLQGSTLLAIPVPGLLEYDGVDIWFTNSAGVRAKVGSGGGSSSQSKIEMVFVPADFAGGSKRVGTVPAGCRIVSTELIVTGAFDAGQATVGDGPAHGRLMVATDNNLLTLDMYKASKNVLYSVDTDIYVYLSGGPTAGSGIVVVYWHQ